MIAPRSVPPDDGLDRFSNTSKFKRQNCSLTHSSAWSVFRGGYWIYERGGALYMKRCRRQCIEARSADQSARSAENFFRLHFSLLRMGSRDTFALCTASSRCMRIAGPRAAMSFFLAYFAHERNTYVHGGVY